MAYNKAEKTDSSMKRRAPRRRKKVCVFCGENNGVIDYKNVAMLKKYVSERGKILPRRITGTVPSMAIVTMKEIFMRLRLFSV